MIKYFLIFICIVFITCSTGKNNIKAENVSSEIQGFFGDEIIQILTSVESVNSYKLKPKKNSDVENIHGFPIIEKGSDLNDSQIGKLQNILLNDKTYDFKMAKKGPFIFPEYAFQFNKGGKKLYILVCFYRKELLFIYNKKELKEDFDFGSEKVKQIINELYKSE